MNKICTSINQSKKLLELGIDVKTADMVYCVELYKEGWKYSNEAYPIDGTLEGDDIPASWLGTEQQVMLRMFLVGQTKSELYKAICDYQSLIRVTDTEGRNMLKPGFNAAQALEV